ncbi:MAG TPA: hypothetical protein VMU29_08350 [Smithella sp.]|nr:hypothetical protein [Smithella sp.]
MIRLRMAHIIILAACFLLVQGGQAVVYGAGVSINYTSTSISPPPTTGGNQAPASPTNSIGAPAATTVSSSTTTGTQNIGSFSSTSVTSTSTNSSTSSTQQLEQQPSTTDNLFQIIEQSETSKLIHLPNFNPLSENETLLPTAESYTVTVCLSYNDFSLPDCRDRKTSFQASAILASMFLNKHLKGTEVRPFRVVLPFLVPLDKQTQLLRKIEIRAIAIIRTAMLEDLKKSKDYLSESEEGRQQKLNTVIEDAKRALQDANSGANWSHHSIDDRINHDFQTSKAFKQFNNDIAVAQRSSQ